MQARVAISFLKGDIAAHLRGGVCADKICADVLAGFVITLFQIHIIRHRALVDFFFAGCPVLACCGVGKTRSALRIDSQTIALCVIRNAADPDCVKSFKNLSSNFIRATSLVSANFSMNRVFIFREQTIAGSSFF